MTVPEHRVEEGLRRKSGNKKKNISGKLCNKKGVCCVTV